MSRPVALALHGGAGASRALDYREHLQHLRRLVGEARKQLEGGSSALNVVEFVVAAMEESGLYVAGRGGSPNLEGRYELDACIMDGRSRRAGAVAGLTGFRSPIAVARSVIQQTSHVLLIGEGAAQFAAAHDHERIANEADWFTHAAAGESNFAPDLLPMSTVGCVALDRDGHLAAATSSAGVFDKMPGRVGDSPLPGLGTWADANVAVTCTGQGELFMQGAAAAQLAFRVAHGSSLRDAARATLVDVVGEWGEGGLAAVSRTGEVVVPFRAEGMKRGVLTSSGEILVDVFGDVIGD